ncbi:CAP domain-containing protein [Flavobacterium yafengii]|uniref:CAP domain-containing protein n=1 Tax=Flavobacterium yafengii TaxID=3041253 RepID=A0AAW6TNP2_9FLAO|nr:CAP domain-containing protein [Flavobacterium yafengii]MDI5950109.1 CAP domain-containing protein [Flavobacterium yafengii]
MKSNVFPVLLLVVIVHATASCSSDNLELQDDKTSSTQEINYTYISSELETMELINAYRVSMGLNALEKINYLSYKSEEHNKYMIANNSVSHNNFVVRSQNIINVLRAKKVGENIAYNYNSPQAVFDAWMNSPRHKENIIGDYTHFGISIRENSANGKKYYTNIFAKI